MSIPKNRVCLWFDKDAEAAARRRAAAAALSQRFPSPGQAA